MTNGHHHTLDRLSGLPLIGAPKVGLGALTPEDQMILGFAAIEGGSHQLLAHDWPPEVVLRLVDVLERLALAFDAKSAGGAAFREAVAKFAEAVRRSITVEPAAVQMVPQA